MYKIASHDSMSYLKPAKWWMRPFRFVAQCQKVNLESQYYDYGIRMFAIQRKMMNTFISPVTLSDEIIESVTNEYTEYNNYINQCKELAADYLRETN